MFYDALAVILFFLVNGSVMVLFIRAKVAEGNALYAMRVAQCEARTEKARADILEARLAPLPEAKPLDPV
jgi:hypothetical protein